MKSKGSTDLKTNSNDVTTALQCHASLHRQSWLQGKIHLLDLGMLLVLTALNSCTQHTLSLNIDPPTLIPNCKLFRRRVSTQTLTRTLKKTIHRPCSCSSLLEARLGQSLRAMKSLASRAVKVWWWELRLTQSCSFSVMPGHGSRR